MTGTLAAQHLLDLDHRRIGTIIGPRGRQVVRRRMPADCSVVGCDDLSFAAYLVPPLTTVRIPFEETGERAATLLLDRIGGKRIPARDLLPVGLVVRASTSSP